MTVGASTRRIGVVSLVDHLVPFGGAEILVAAIAKGLNAARFEPIVCATRTVDPRVRADLEDAGVRVMHLGRESRARVDQWWPLVQLLRRENVPIVHAHKFGSNAWASLLRRIVSVPVVIAHEHVWSFDGDLIRQLVDRHLIARSVDVMLAVSQHTRNQMIAVERLPAGRVRVFTHGIPSAPSTRSVDRAALGLADDDFVVATVCVLRPQKAVQTLLEAVEMLRETIPRLRVLIVGDGSERERLERFVDVHRLHDIVRFLGHRSDVPGLLPIVDVCVNPSRFEGSPLAVMEFMAAGRAIVATAVGGVPEILEDRVSGVLVPPQDPVRLAAAIAELAADPSLRAELGYHARERQRALYDLDTNIGNLEDLYEEFLRRAATKESR